MIKLDRPATPTILQANEQLWTSELLSAIAQHGSFAKIPGNIRESLIQHYRRDEIKAALLSSSYHKCAFCESPLSGGISIEVEHYAPKSLYPDRTFDWNNLLPACRKCNVHKADLDTISQPIVNPYVDEPDQYFEYDLMLILPKTSNPSHDKAS